MKQTLQIFLLLLVSVVASAQNLQRKYLSHKENGNNLEVNTSDGQYLIKFYSDEIAETSFIPKGEVFNPASHAVIMYPEKMKTRLHETPESISYSSKGIEVVITKSPFTVSYTYRNKPLLSEKNGYIKNDSTETLEFNLVPTEALYGGGARVLGMNRRGNRLQLYNRAHYGYETRSELMNFTMPLVISSKIYAVHFDNPSIGFLDLDSKKDNTLSYETISGRKTYQVIAAATWADLIDSYTSLTGRQPMPPRWALGNFASRFGYHSQAEVERTIKKFRDEKIPVDAIILDLYWFGKEVKGTMGNLSIDRDSFPNFEQMAADLKEDGVKTILITEPFILTTSSKWQEAVDNNILATDTLGKPFTYDFYFGNTGLIDIFKPEGRIWFWNIYKELALKGAGGVWGDLGEPEVHPSALRHATGTADELHNIYGHNWAKLVHEGYKKDFPNDRPFILMRSGYSGSQRFGMLPWSGDVSRSWGGLSGQPEISLQMGMQGMGYMHSDLGGFAGANLDDELYTRWLQYGVFQPIFRPHAQEDVAAEPVFRSEKAKDLARKSIELRYKLLPYNYTLSFENHVKGTPLMRPMIFEEPENVGLQNVADQYFWGNDFLVAPILLSAVKERTIYFPKSSNWFDFYTGLKYRAGTTAQIATAEDHIPVFVRGGAFIAMAPVVQTTKDYNLKNLDLHYYFDSDAKSSKARVYNDDGITAEAFEKGRYEILNFTSKVEGDQLLLHLDLDKGNINSTDKKLNIIIHNLDKKPRKLRVDGKKVKSNWDKKQRIFKFNATCKSEDPKEITIHLAQ
ncbi:MAG TPA: TIM-barrel domain-containing protein [Flavobacterium sp.]